MLRHVARTIAICVGMAAPVISAQTAATTRAAYSAIDVAPVWSGHPVGFVLLTHGDQQYVAYYAADRRMTVAQRQLGSDKWSYTPLPTSVGWDSHNYIAMAFDDAGHLHVSGNMHAVPLVYFRTTKPGDASSLQKIDKMLGTMEDRCTYPRFLRGGTGELLFAYRDGSSGNGVDVYNVYDTQSQTWRRLLDTPLLDGHNHTPTANAYSVGPTKGPDGKFHLVWVWRNNPDASMNHDVSYARSADLIHWETAAGAPLTLPITPDTAGVVIDPVPVKGGVINGNTKLGFDSLKRPVVSYHKFDADGRTQIYNARLEEGVWKIYQTSHWDYRWEIAGRGSLNFEVRLSGVSPAGAGFVAQDYTHAKEGSGVWKLKEEDFSIAGRIERPADRPAELSKVESALPGMEVRWAGDSGKSADGKRYLLRWETLPVNQDRAREGPLPEPSMLRVYELGR